jgi:hypothetical protein
MPETTAQDHRIWLLKLVFRFPFGGLLSGVLIFTVLYGLFRIFADFAVVGIYSTLFLCGMVAYIIPVFALIVDRSVLAFDALASLLDASPEQRSQWRRSLDHRSTSWTVTITALGLGMGLAHMMILHFASSGSPADIYDNGSALMSAIGTLLIWLTMTTVISALMSNALLFFRLGRDHLRIDLLNARELVPLAWVAVISTLSMIGAQALFVLLIIDANARMESVLPGFLATTIPMVPLFILPIWSAHRRLKVAKSEELNAIRTRLEQAREGLDTALEEPVKLAQLNDLLSYRREIMGVSEWPFDLGAVSRLGLYLIIPPLTWVGAALIENLVETLL